MNREIDIRPAAVAGSFYPEDAAELRAVLRRFLGAVETAAPPPGTVKALIVPHAGYVYSGPIAASAYALLAPLRERIRRVVLLGPAHRVPVRSLALPPESGFATPLGVVPLDADAVARLQALPQVAVSRGAHALEHSLEVQLPFLQTVLSGFSLVPLVVGDATPAEVAAVLDAVWGGAETLIVVSSDLSHYRTYAQARRLDRETCEAICSPSVEVDHDQACGGTPVNGLLRVTRRRGLGAHLLDLRNSGDTAGDRLRVVGYAALAFTGNGDGDFH